MTNSTDFMVIAVLLALALAVGGAGVSFPLLQMLLQMAALATAAYLVATRRNWRLGRESHMALGFLTATLLLPLLQLIPLPPSIWTQLPGRGLPTQVDAALGVTRWRPVTLDIEATFRSFLSLVPPTVIFAGSLFLPRGERARLLWVILGFAVASALLGVVQMATGGGFTPYPSAHLGDPIGLFVNRNHQTALLLVAMPVAAALSSGQITRGKPEIPWLVASISAILIFATAIMGTTSRLGLILLPLSLIGSLGLLFYRRGAVRLLSISVLVFAAVAVLLLASVRSNRIFSRFSELADARFGYWNDIAWALDYYGLSGTGFGTFIPIYKSAESLESITPRITNHAHNDYLEILIEGGAGGALLLLIFGAFLIFTILRSFRVKEMPGQAATAGAAAIGLVVLLIVSFVDFPLRMPALSSVFAVFFALLLPYRSAAASTQSERAFIRLPKSRVHGRVLIAWVVLAAMLVLVIQAGISAHHLLNRNYKAALDFASWSTKAREHLATQALLENDLAGARSHGRAAIALSPISAPAIRTVGLVRLSQGAVAEGSGLMQIASSLGWRDPLTQLWAIQATKISREPRKSIERAEALFRQRIFGPTILALLQEPVSTEATALLIGKLAQKPEWRRDFIRSGSQVAAPSIYRFTDLIVRLGDTSAPPTQDEADPLFERLLILGRVGEARRLWAAIHSDDLVLNGDFKRVDTGRPGGLPADWDISAEDVASLHVGKSGHGSNGQSLRVSSTRGSAPIISQRLMLGPGVYRLSYRARKGSGGELILRWEIRCSPSRLDVVADSTIPNQTWEAFTAVLAVPYRDCWIQRLALKRLGETRPAEFWIDNIRIQPGPR